ncbi:MAG: PAS domain S-box protein, partial [Thermoplasmatota archaeon]
KKSLKESDQKLRESRKKYQKIFYDSPVGAFHYNRKGVITECNDRFVKIIGSSRKAVIGLDMLNALDNADLIDEVRSSLEDGEGYYEGEYTSVTGDKTINVKVFLKGIEDEDGRINSGIGLVEDNTERKEYERELKRKERYLDRTPTYITVIDEEGEMKYHSYPSNKITGLDPSKIIGAEAIEFVHPEDREDAMEMFSKVFENPGEEYRTELRGKVEDGWIWLEIRAVNYLDDPEINGIIVSAQDISDRKEIEEELQESEKKFRTVIENSADAIFLTDQEGNYTYANEAASDLLGYSREELMEMNIVDIIPDKDVENGLEIFEKMLEEEQVLTEMTLLAKDGTEIPVDLNGVLLPNGKIYGSCRDITERKEAEEELKKQEEKYRSIFEQFQDLYYRTDLEGNIEELSPSVEDLSGYSRDELIGEPVSKVYLDPEERAELLNELLEDGEVKGYEMKLKKKSGETAIVSVNSHLVKDEDGEVKGVEGTIRNITEKKEAEEKLRESEQRLDLALKGAELGVWDWNVKTDEVQYSERWAEMLGYSHDEIEQNLASWEERLYPDERSRVKEELQRHLKGETEIYKTEHRMKTKSGDWIWVKDVGKCLKRDVNGEPVRATGIIEDITDRKEFEEKLRESEKRHKELSEELENILDHIPGLVYYKDTENNFIKVNKKLAEAHGMSKKEMEGKNLFDLYPEEEAQKYLEDDKEVMENREPKLNMIEPWSPDEERWMSTSKIPYIVGGEVKGIIGISIDVTEEKKNRERAELLHTILRHDIKNKAQGVQGYLQLLEEREELSEDSKDFLEGALTANKESVNLIQKVRLLLSAQEEETKPVQIVFTIRNAVESNEAMAERMGIDLSLNCPSTECKVEGGSLLEEVFYNIIENSIRHSGGSRIKVNGEVKDDEVVCSIEDDGKGIPDDKKETIFEKGYTTDEERGTGLGLFLVKNLLESYGGDIEVKDSKLGGARFDVHLKKA